MNDGQNTAEIAREIFYHFDINQSCTLSGFVMDDKNQKCLPVGEVVLECLRQLDINENFGKDGVKGTRRKRVMLPNSIGGFVAQKIFKYKSENRDGKLVYFIWRVQ